MTTLLENLVEEKEGTNVRVKLFTHTDLDGIGCAVMGKAAFGADNCDPVYCNYKDVDEKIRDFLMSPEYDNFDVAFITDISVGPELAAMINSSFADRVQLLDHHNTALWLNDYSWAYVSQTEDPLPGVNDGRKTRLASGTSLFFGYLYSNGFLKDTSLVEFAEFVRMYDSWEWHDVYNETTANQLNILFGQIGRYKFVDRFVSKSEVIFTKSERDMIEAEQFRIERYIKGKMNTVFPLDIAEHKAGVVYAEQYHSELGNALSIAYPEYDFIAMINFGTMSVSYRSAHEGIDIGADIAKLYGGGGHPKSAGSPINQLYAEAFAKIMFKSPTTGNN
ncbi:Oligoribonuclease NrnB [compost metagenome]